MSRQGARTAVILVVEDDPHDQMITRRALKMSKLHNQLFVAEDGEQALDYLWHRGEFAAPGSSPRPDLILLDLNLPKLDGRAVLREIKQDPGLRRIAVVVLTTSSQEEDILQSYDLGVNSYLTKPVSMDGFVKAIRDIEHYWFELVVLPE